MRLNEHKVELLTGLKSTARTSTQRGTRKRAKLLDFPFILIEPELVAQPEWNSKPETAPKEVEFEE